MLDLGDNLTEILRTIQKSPSGNFPYVLVITWLSPFRKLSLAADTDRLAQRVALRLICIAHQYRHWRIEVGSLTPVFP